MQPGKFNCIIDQAWGSSGKGKISTWLADHFKINHVSSSNYPNAGHCQTADTWIITEKGLERLGEVIKNKLSHKVINMDGKWEEISNFIDDGKRKINKIILENGIEFKCTDIHQYYVWDSESGQLSWVKSIDLDERIHQFVFPKYVEFPENPLIEDFVCQQKPNKTIISKPNDIKFAQYLGQLVGDGYYAHKGKIDLAFHISQLDSLESVKELYQEMGITDISEYKVKDKDCVVLTTTQISGLKDLFSIVGLELLTKDQKKTPARIFTSSKQIIGAYLRGFFDSDGSAKKDRVLISNCSENLIKDSQILLYVLGIHSNYSYYDDSRDTRKRQHCLSISGSENLELFKNNVGFISEIKNSKLDNIIASKTTIGKVLFINRKTVRELSKIRTSYKPGMRCSFIKEHRDEIINLGYSNLVNITDNFHIIPIKIIGYEIGEEEVFDITVPNTHSYVANGSISHNSVVWSDGFKFIAKAIPTAACLKRTKGSPLQCFISPGSGFSWDQLLKEWKEAGRPKIYIHDRASIVTELHKERERAGSESTKHVASTMQGTAAAITDKILRKADVILARNTELMPDEEDFRQYVEVIDALLFRNITHSLINEGHTWLHEGSQGYALSIDHGSQYPSCTSRNCTIQSYMDHMAISPALVGDVYLNLRTYPIRVGNVYENGERLGYSGDFYPDCQELTWEEVGKRAGMPKEEQEKLLERELTTVTKRLRRVSTFSWIGLEDAIRTNGVTKISINFIQYLNWKDYNLQGGREAFEKLSKESREFIAKIEEVTNVPVVLIGTGASHEQIISLL